MTMKELRIAPPPARIAWGKGFKGFTLAEVLITLGVIGIVAALTMPALVANYKNKVFISQTKKTYSTILNAFEKWKYDKGAEDFTGVFDQNKTKAQLAEEFFSYFNTIQICKAGETGCIERYIKYSKAKNDGQGKNSKKDTLNFYKAVLNDGSSLALIPYVGGDSSCGRTFTDKVTDSNGNWVSDGKGGYLEKETYQKQCAVLLIDSNGLKRPNQLNADVYGFIISDKKILNWNSEIDTVLTDENLIYQDYDLEGDFSN